MPDMSRRAFLCTCGLGLGALLGPSSVFADGTSQINVFQQSMFNPSATSGGVIAGLIGLLFGTVSSGLGSAWVGTLTNQWESYRAAHDDPATNALDDFINGACEVGSIVLGKLNEAVMQGLYAFNAWLRSVLLPGASSVKINGWDFPGKVSETVNTTFNLQGNDWWSNPSSSHPAIWSALPAFPGGTTSGNLAQGVKLADNSSLIDFTIDGKTYKNKALYAIVRYANGNFALRIGGGENNARTKLTAAFPGVDFGFQEFSGLLIDKDNKKAWDLFGAYDNLNVSASALTWAKGQAIGVIDGDDVVGILLPGEDVFIPAPASSADVVITPGKGGAEVADDSPDVVTSGTAAAFDRVLGHGIEVADDLIIGGGRLSIPPTDAVIGSWNDAATLTGGGLLTDAAIGKGATISSPAVAGSSAGAITEGVGSLTSGSNAAGIPNDSSLGASIYWPSALALDFFPFNLPAKFSNLLSSLTSASGDPWHFTLPFHYGDIINEDPVVDLSMLKPVAPLTSLFSKVGYLFLGWKAISRLLGGGSGDGSGSDSGGE